MAFTSYLQTQLLNASFRKTAYTPPTKVYVGLFKTTGEVTGGGYARQEITFSAPTSDGGGMKIVNNAEVRFPIATANWGEVKHTVVFDAVSGGNKLDEANLVASREVRENDQFILPVGNTSIKLK